MTRGLQCTNDEEEALSDTQCEEVATRLGASSTRQCNSAPCEIPIYEVGEWQSCDCEAGVSVRSVQCTHASNPGISVNEEFCSILGMERPQQTSLCNCTAQPPRRALLQADDICEGTPCSGNSCCCFHFSCKLHIILTPLQLT